MSWSRMDKAASALADDDRRRETMEREGLMGLGQTHTDNGWPLLRRTKHVRTAVRRSTPSGQCKFFARICATKRWTSAESGYERVSHRLRSANLASPNAAAIACAKRCQCRSVPVLNAHHLIVAIISWLAWRRLGALTMIPRRP